MLLIIKSVEVKIKGKDLCAGDLDILLMITIWIIVNDCCG
jgi:hypothetical protein